MSCEDGAAASGDRRHLNQDVEGAELHLLVMLAGMERIEIRDAVNAQDHRLAVEDEELLADLPGSLDDPVISARAGEQAHAIAIRGRG